MSTKTSRSRFTLKAPCPLLDVGIYEMFVDKIELEDILQVLVTFLSFFAISRHDYNRSSYDHKS